MYMVCAWRLCVGNLCWIDTCICLPTHARQSIDTPPNHPTPNAQTQHKQTTRGLSAVQVVAGHSHSFVLCEGRSGKQRGGAPGAPQQVCEVENKNEWCSCEFIATEGQIDTTHVHIPTRPKTPTHPHVPQKQELYAFGSDRWLQLGLGEAWAERGGPLVRRPQRVTALPGNGGVGGIAAGV